MVYYLIEKNKIGKIENHVPYFYRIGKGWEVDDSNILMDKVIGYDGDELGNSDVLGSVKEITEKEVIKLIAKLKD